MLSAARMATGAFSRKHTTMDAHSGDDEEAILSKLLVLLRDPSAMQNKWANGVSGKAKNFGVKIKSILHDVGLIRPADTS